MEPDEYARIAAVEDDHWWYRNTRALLADALAPWLGTGQTILDAGCGPGGNGAWLGDHGRVVAVDLAPEALHFVHTRRPALTPVQASVDALPFDDRSFDVVVGVTVVYSVPDDVAALRELARVLRPGGALMLLEPAFAALRRAHDAKVHTVRRYRRAGLEAVVAGAGLRLERSAYAYSFLAPAALGLAVTERIRRRSDETVSDVDRRTLDSVFAPLAALERRWLRRGKVPFGTSVLVVASRPL